MSVINFLIIALILYIILSAFIKAQSLTKRNQEEEAPTTKTCPFCMSTISVKATRCPHCTSELNMKAAEK